MPALNITQEERKTMAYSPQTLEIIRLAKEGCQPKKINEIMPHLHISTITKAMARARAKGDLNVYFNKDGTTKAKRRNISDKDAVRNYVLKRRINLGRTIDAIENVSPDTLRWVVREIKREGYTNLGEFLRDLVIEAYDNRERIEEPVAKLSEKDEVILQKLRDIARVAVKGGHNGKAA